MSRLTRLVEHLSDPALKEGGDDEENPYSSGPTYAQIIQKLESSGISDLEVILDLRSIVFAEMAYGGGVYLDGGGPGVRDRTLNLGAARDLAGLLKNVLDIQKFLELEQEADREAALEAAAHAHTAQEADMEATEEADTPETHEDGHELP